MATAAITAKKGILKGMIAPMKMKLPKEMPMKRPKDPAGKAIFDHLVPPKKLPDQLPLKMRPNKMDQLPLKMRKMKEKMMPKEGERGGLIPSHIKERMRRQANLA